MQNVLRFGIVRINPCLMCKRFTGMYAGCVWVKDAALAAEVLAMEAALRPKKAALQARAAAHKAEFAFLLQLNEAAQQARDAVVLSTALFPFSSDAAHRAPFVLLSPDCLTVTRISGDTLARARSERSWPAFPLDAAQ